MLKVLSMVLGWFTGGTLNSILATIDKHMDNKVSSEQIKADVTKTYVEAQAKLLVGRTWWFQLFFVIPMGVHWAALNFVSAFPMWGWTVHALPDPFDDYQGMILSALFVVDAGKALIGRFGK